MYVACIRFAEQLFEIVFTRMQQKCILSGVAAKERPAAIETTIERKEYRMKRSVKWLALLLAGLLLTASLAACTAKQGDAGEGAQDQQNDQNDQNADKLLTPAALRQAIINGEEMSIFVESGWAGDENEYVYIRDGDKAKRSIGEDVRYYDFAEAKRYGYFPEEDRWEVFELTQPDWASFVNELIWTDDGADPLLMDENYTLKDGRYVLTEAGDMAELEYVR